VIDGAPVPPVHAATSTLVPPDSGLTHACELCITASSTSAVLLAVGLPRYAFQVMPHPKDEPDWTK
jgi:hypothetical protein